MHDDRRDRSTCDADIHLIPSAIRRPRARIRAGRYQLAAALRVGIFVRGRKKRRPATVVRYMVAMSHGYAVAIRDWEWADSNPVPLVRKPKEPRVRVRYLSEDERASLLTACSDSGSGDLYTVVVVALSTGMRRGELTALRWRRVDPVRHTITLTETRNGERLNLRLCGPALDLLSARARVHESIRTWCSPARAASVRLS